MAISTLNLPPHGESNWDSKLNSAFETLRVGHNNNESAIAALAGSVAPVSSVAGKTGAVNLVAADVSGVATTAQVNAKYSLPAGNIPLTDLAAAVQTSLGKADTAYQKPVGNIPKTDLATAVQTSLTKADGSAQVADGPSYERRYSSGSYPVRGSVPDGVAITWKGPVAPIVSSTYALAGVDFWMVTAS